MEQHYELGSYIRRRYGRFLNDSYKHDQASWGTRTLNLNPWKKINIILHAHEELIPLPIFWRSYTQMYCLQMCCCLWNYFPLKIYEFLVHFWLSVADQFNYWSTACFTPLHVLVLSIHPLDMIMTFPQCLMISWASLQLFPWHPVSSTERKRFLLIFHLLWFIFL